MSNVLVDSHIGDVVVPVLMGAGIGSSLIKTVDPVATNDLTQGFVPGSVWFNATPGKLRWWQCRLATKNAASWVFMGADYPNGGTNPATEVTAFGSGAALVAAEGNIFREVLAAAGRNPGATNVDNVIAVYSMPLLSLDASGRGVNILAQGSVANNANSKRIKVYWGCTAAVIGSTVSGGVVVADTGAYATANNVGWSLEANVFKRGALGSNTQLAIHMSAQIGATVGSLLPPSDLTSGENAAILIAVTGNAATTATDITQNFFEINAMN